MPPEPYLVEDPRRKGKWLSVWPDRGHGPTAFEHDSYEIGWEFLFSGGYKPPPQPPADPTEVDRLRLDMIREARCPQCGKRKTEVPHGHTV